MPASPHPLRVDPSDFDAVGVLADLVVALRSHAFVRGLDTVATLSAPPGWHRLLVTARGSGHLVLSIRFTGLSGSRWNNVEDGLTRLGWRVDDDGEGATRTYPPGTDAMSVAFDIPGILTLAGAPREVREVTAADAGGEEIYLSGPQP